MATFENNMVGITGGTSRIGKATPLAFSQESANVVVSSRRISDGENAAFTTGQDTIVAGGFSAP